MFGNCISERLRAPNTEGNVTLCVALQFVFFTKCYVMCSFTVRVLYKMLVLRNQNASFGRHMERVRQTTNIGRSVRKFVSVAYNFVTSQWPRGLTHGVSGRSLTGIVDSNPAEGMDVCVL